MYEELSSITAEDVKWEIETAGDEFEDDYGYIRWSQASAYLNAVEDILVEEVPGYVAAHLYYEAFDIALYALITMCNKDMDDSGGEILAIGDDVTRYWKAILEFADLKSQKKMFNTLCRLETAKRTHDYAREVIFDFRHSAFRDEYFLEKLDAEVSEILEKGKGKTFEEEIAYERALATGADILCSGKGSEEDVDEFLKKFSDISDVEERIYRYYVDKKLTDKALKLVDRLLSSYSYRIDKEEIINDLYKLLQLEGRKDEARSFLISKVVDKNYAEDIEPFMEIRKSVSADEWRLIRERIYCRYDSEKLSYDLMAEEGESERIFDKLEGRDFTLYAEQQMFYSLKAKLKKLDPARTMEIHLKVLDGKMIKSKPRSYYKWVIEELGRIRRDYPDGAVASQSLADSWRKKYKSRTAMLEELENNNF